MTPDYILAINELCERYTKEQLAGMLFSYKSVNELLREDNNSLRNENETLRHLIAKYKIESS